MQVGWSLEDGEIEAAEGRCRIEADMETAQGWDRLPGLQVRLKQVQEQARSCRGTLDEAKRYRDSIESLVG